MGKEVQWRGQLAWGAYENEPTPSWWGLVDLQTSNGLCALRVPCPSESPGCMTGTPVHIPPSLAFSSTDMQFLCCAAALLLAGFWTFISIFSQVFARAHRLPPAAVVRTKKRASRQPTRKHVTDKQLEPVVPRVTFTSPFEENNGRSPSQPKLLRSLSAFVQHRERRGSDDSTSSFDTYSGGSTTSDDSSYMSSGSSSAHLSQAADKAKHAFQAAAARPAMMKRSLTHAIVLRRTKSSGKSVVWGDVDQTA
ncbi:hypothetical protein EXIGLDRAFT_841192 [Exidia glandulosa HHB12029]|uniref:Transmembrane protein n=1 Tax=Exidia glandulosa HHB12029 TaxID=1314781 RepID=A0A165E167_EXIGL|nr:hypothetical protein EXIGLDRAFT_841192 [Exidia glandulosa HHB12029]